MKIACIGNSHLASFKLGWQRVRDVHESIEIDFFGAAASAMRYLDIAGDRLVPTNDDTRRQMINTGGKAEITNDYDAYILVGMGIGVVHLVNAYRFHRPVKFYDGHTQIVSDDFIAKVRLHLIDHSAAVLNMRRLRKITSSKIFVAQNPLPTSDVLEKPGCAVWANPGILADCQTYLDRVLLREYSSATLVSQPAETLAGEYLTKPEFTRNAEVLKDGGTKATNAGDPWHMNAEYGAVFLKEILSRINVITD